MSGSDNSPIESEVPLFNVHASIPEGVDIEEIDRRLRASAHMPEERIDYLINSLKTFPRLQIGTNVPLDRANKAREQFSTSGLRIEVSPVLSLEKMAAEEEKVGVYRCPACSHEGELTEDRRCTKCGVFVDKMNEEELLKRRIMEQERMKYELQRSKDDKESKKRKKQETEARIREEVRKELESEFGVPEKDDSLLSGTKGKLLVGAGLIVFAVAAFYGGQAFQKSSSDSADKSKTAEKNSKDPAASVDKMLDAIGPQAEAGAAAGAGGGAAGGTEAGAAGAVGGSGGGGAAGAAGAAGTAGAVAAAGGGGEPASAGGDPIFNDPFLDAASKGRKGTLTMEQAVAASMTLAKAVGNTTAERALNGTLPNAPAGATLVGSGAGAGGAVGGAGLAGVAAATGAGGAGPSMGAGPAVGGSGAPVPISTGAAPGASISIAGSGGSYGGGSGGGSYAGPAGGGGKAAVEAPVEVPKQTKLLLTLDFAKHLAELGQSARANEVIKRVKASPTLVAYPDLDSAVRLTELETQAWGVLSLTEGRARTLVESLLTGAAGLTDTAERATALSRMGFIVSKNTQLPPEAARVFLTKAAESLKAIPDGAARRNAMTTWTATLGEVIVAGATQYARTGQWAKVKTASTQLDELIKSSSDPQALARLYGSQYRMRQIIGQQDKLTQSLQAALSAAGKSSDPLQHALALRSIAHSVGPGALELMRSSLDTLKNQASSRSGLARTQALTQLVLIYADAGAKQQADAVAALVPATPGLKPAEELGAATELLIMSDLAQARSAHTNGSYAEAEAILRRLAGYML